MTMNENISIQWYFRHVFYTQQNGCQNHSIILQDQLSQKVFRTPVAVVSVQFSHIYICHYGLINCRIFDMAHDIMSKLLLSKSKFVREESYTDIMIT